MTPTYRTAIAAALALIFSSVAPVAHAAEAKVPPKGVPARAKAPARQPVPAPEEESLRNHPGQAIYQILLGEIALQRGNPDLAVSAYGDLAYRTRDIKVLERTVEVASIGRRFDVAAEAARMWVDLEPESLPARQTYAATLVMQGRLDELQPQLALLLEKDKANLPDNLMRLNRMLARHQDKLAVFRMLEKLVAPYASLPEAHFALATAAFHAGIQQHALNEIRQALEQRPDWDQAALFEAQLLARESTADALESLQRYLDRNPRSRDVRLQLARALVAEKRYPEARRHFDRLLRDNPDSPELIYPVAVLALQQEDVDTAEPLLRRLLERGDLSERNVAAFYLGQIAEDRKQYDAAIGYFREVNGGEQMATAQVRVAQLLVRAGAGLGEARESLHAAAKRYPAGETQFLLAEAQLLRDAGREAEALALLDRALARQPDQAEILYDAAMLAEKLGRLDVVEKNLRRVIELKPENAHAYNALGYTFADRNLRLDEARELIARALALAPDDPFIIDSMGWVLYRQGELAAALEQLQKAYARKPDAEIAAHLGEVLWALGRQEEARAVWREAAKRHPDNAELTTVMKKFAP